MTDKNVQVIYTDGSCIPNPGPGGWGFITLPNDEPYEYHVSGSSKKTTNNRMELTAVIEALLFTPKTTNYVIYSDSMYVINCATKKWSRKKNTDLWEEYDKVSVCKKIKWIWVKAHSTDIYNNMVDILANKEAKSIT